MSLKNIIYIKPQFIENKKEKTFFRFTQTPPKSMIAKFNRFCTVEPASCADPAKRSAYKERNKDILCVTSMLCIL